MTPPLEARRAEVAAAVRDAFADDTAPPAQVRLRDGLLTALDRPWTRPLDPETARLVHAMTWVLRPNPCAVRAGRTVDDEACTLRERLTRAQRTAVARFLGLVVGCADDDRGLAWLAAQAITWAWTDHAPTTAAARALRAAAHRYERVPAPDGPSEDLARAVERAFADTPAPTGPWMTSTSEEPSTHEIELASARWQDLTPWFVSWHREAFCYTTDAAFRYLLPAALRHELVHGCEVPLGFHLVDQVLLPTEGPDAALARICAFTDEERAVVADVLDWLFCVGEEEPPGDVITAIQDHWDPVTGVGSAA